MALVPAIHVELPYSIDGKLLFLQLDLVSVRREFAREGTNVIRKCSREENDLHGMGTWQHTE